MAKATAGGGFAFLYFTWGAGRRAGCRFRIRSLVHHVVRPSLVAFCFTLLAGMPAVGFWVVVVW